MQFRTACHIIFNGLRGAFRRDISLDSPDPAVPNPADKPLVERIAAAYRRMTQAQSPEWWRPSTEWQVQLDLAFASLRDPKRFHYFLANFGQWPIYTGIEEGGYAIQRAKRFWIGRRYLEEIFFRRTLRAWERQNRPLSALSLPRYGNQAGAWYRDTFVSAGAAFNDLISLQLVKLAECERPVLAELGAGYGKLAYCTLRNLPRFCYLDFDLPETLCTAAYYLGKCFPSKQLLLYGERDFTSECLTDYDMVFMPPWEIDRLPEASIDLFFNKNSLGEMTPAATNAYLDHIGRVTRGHFFHLNHDSIRCGGGLLAREYKIPGSLQLVSREPDPGHLLTQSIAEPDIFQYLYARA